REAASKLIRDAGLRLGIVYEDAATASYFTRLEGSTRTSISTALWLASTEPTAHKYVRSASNGENSNRGVKTTKERPEMRSFIRIVALAVALVIPGSAFAQQYPSKPVKIIVPFPPAGVTDIVGRLVAQKLSEKLGEQFYIENIAGAGGNLGMGQAARSPGDGYTILFASSSIVVNPTLYSKVPFDIDKDFVYEGRRNAQFLADQSKLSSVDDGGPDRHHQERARQVQCRLAGNRHHALTFDRDAETRAWA